MGSDSANNTGPGASKTAPPAGQTNKDDPRAAYVTAASSSRGLVRRGLKAALATFDAAPESGATTPYASLVITATAPEGSPLLLISNLARHTKNLQENARASLLFDETGPKGDLSTSARVTLIGSLEPTPDKALARRFIARHPDSAGYASFADFNFYKMTVEGGHYVGGFGRITDVASPDLLTDLKGASALIKAGPDIIDHMNEEHTDALELYATRLLGAHKDDGPWIMTGIDPAGFDIVGTRSALRLDFESRVENPQQARSIFKDLAAKARAQS